MREADRTIRLTMTLALVRRFVAQFICRPDLSARAEVVAAKRAVELGR
jgi:hypothetical protein